MSNLLRNHKILSRKDNKGVLGILLVKKIVGVYETFQIAPFIIQGLKDAPTTRSVSSAQHIHVSVA